MTAAPSSLPLVEPYFAAWTARAPDAVAAAFAEGGSYTGPTVTGPPLTGTAITEHARALLTAFPDLSFEILDGQPADGRVITQWLMRGTKTGPWNWQPPTGRPVAMRGVDVVTVTAGKITSVERYFDRQAMAEQLGFQMRPLPPALMRPGCSKANTERTPCPVAAETGPDLAVASPGLHEMRWRENQS